MPKPPPLTDWQKNQLHRLEPQLRACLPTGDIAKAKKLAGKIQHILKDTGHTTRWMQNTNWLAECALEAGEISFAIQRLEGVRAVVAESTRIYLEATALLSLCYLRRKRLDEAKLLIAETIANVNNITSDNRRRQFNKRFVERIEEECILAGIMSGATEPVDVNKIQEEAVKLLHLDEGSILILLGNSLPSNSIALLENARNYTLKQIPSADRKLLPSPKQAVVPKKLGKRTLKAVKRVVWRAVCDPSDEIYQAWSAGLSVVYDKKWIATAIVSSCVSWNITTNMVLASVVALAFKTGVKVFCDLFAPESIMIGLSD